MRCCDGHVVRCDGGANGDRAAGAGSHLDLWLASGAGSGVLVSQFTPAGLEELAHAVACLANGRIVLVKHLAIIEDLTHVHAEVLTGFVAQILQFLFDCGQVHGSFDYFSICGKLLGVYWQKKWPRVLMKLHFPQ